MEDELLDGIEYDSVEPTLRQRIFGFLRAVGIIKSPNWIFGGD